MWQEFNIKPFPAETIVFRDGIYIPELSTLPYGAINKNYDLPVHIIYVGEIASENELNVDITVDNQPVYLSVNIKNKKPAFFNIFVKNAGKNSDFRAHVMMENSSTLKFDCSGRHLTGKNTILFAVKLIANRGSVSNLSGTAIIDENCNDCESDINFSALSDKTAKITFLPKQKISSEPTRADHSASIYKPKDAQILYLRQSGLSGAEVDTALREAFVNDFNLF